MSYPSLFTKTGPMIYVLVACW